MNLNVENHICHNYATDLSVKTFFFGKYFKAELFFQSKSLLPYNFYALYHTFTSDFKNIFIYSLRGIIDWNYHTNGAWIVQQQAANVSLKKQNERKYKWVIFSGVMFVSSNGYYYCWFEQKIHAAFRNSVGTPFYFYM